MQNISLSVAQAVSSTGIGRTTIYKALAVGDLQAKKAGTRTLIMSNDLEAWLNSLPALKPSKAENS